MELSFRQNRIIREQGRPKAGTNPLIAYAEEAPSKTIGVLVNEAVRRNLSLEGLAALSRRDPRSLAKTIALTRTPHLATVTELAQALGFAPVVARALLHTLDERDELAERDAYNLRHSMLRAVLDRQAIFDNAFAVHDALVAALDAASLEKRYAALAAFVLAEVGLKSPTGPGFDLAPELFALADALGVDLAAHVADSTRFAEEREPEMLAARDWMFQAFPFSTDERATIAAICAHYIRPSDRAPGHALVAAVAEYHRRRREPETLAGILTGFAPTTKGTEA